MYIHMKTGGRIMGSLSNQIKELKERKNAVILAHNYQNSEVQDIADFVGDSFALAKRARETDYDVIVFCGVRFMAETAKILSPKKTVLLPAVDAGCPMADMITVDDVMKLTQQYPEAAVVCYVNSSAAVKAVSDVCCTSSNAVKVVKSLPNRQIIFIPDKNLGRYIAGLVPEKEIILYNGYCITHNRVQIKEVKAAKKLVPDAKLVVHPECMPEVVKEADFVGSTAQIIQYVTCSKQREFIIGTEQGVLHCLQKNNSDKRFYLLSPKLICTNMKKTTLREVWNALRYMKFQIQVKEDVASKARKCLEKMLQYD